MSTAKPKRFKVASTALTPLVVYRPTEGFFKIQGRSSPKSSLDFYYPIIRTLQRHRPSSGELIAEFHMEYFNTSSSKCIYDIFHTLQKFAKEGIGIQIKWFYHEWDDDMLETGEDFKSASGLDFQFIENHS